MATVPAHSGIVRGAAARPGGLPPVRPQATPAVAQPAPRTQTVVPQGTPNVPAAVTARPFAAATEKKLAEAVEAAMGKHYRDAMTDSRLDYSSAWSEAKIAVRYMNFLSPLLLGVMRQSGGTSDLEANKTSLQFLAGSTNALAEAISGHLSKYPQLSLFEGLELQSTLAHLVGRVWERSSPATAQDTVDQMLKTTVALFADNDFQKRNQSQAQTLCKAGGYRAVDSEETMASRLRVSLHLATFRLLEAVLDERLGNGKGDIFTYGLRPEAIVSKLAQRLDQMLSELFARTQFHDDLTNDQRTVLVQAWTRQAGEIMGGEYVARTRRLMDWFRAEPGALTSRFAMAKASLPTVVDEVSDFAAQTLRSLVDMVGFSSMSSMPVERESRVFTANDGVGRPERS